MAMDFSSFKVVEDQDFTQGTPSLKDVALMHIKKISEICCQEFTQGYWQEKPVKVGTGIAFTRVYHPDSRAAFCNAIDFLVWIVYPNSDPEFQKIIDDLDLITTKEKEDWIPRIEGRKRIFKELNLMFERMNFFTTSMGRTETSKQ